MNRNNIQKKWAASENTKCLYSQCNKKPSKNHSIQNKIFDLLGGNIITLCDETPNSLFKLIDTNDLKKSLNFKEIGRSNASIFHGFCTEHDNKIFEKIDKKKISLDDKEQLFLIAYRSMIKEYLLKKFAKLDILNKEDIKNELQYLFSCFNNQDNLDFMEKYKTNMDNILQSRQYEKVKHICFEIKTKPTIACSQLFSLDENNSFIYKGEKNLPILKEMELASLASTFIKDIFARVILNIFPVEEKKTIIIFSSLEEDYDKMEKYLTSIINEKDVKLFKRKISEVVVKNSENFFINKNYFNTWTSKKKNEIKKMYIEGITKIELSNKLNFNLFL